MTSSHFRIYPPDLLTRPDGPAVCQGLRYYSNKDRHSLGPTQPGEAEQTVGKQRPRVVTGEGGAGIWVCVVCGVERAGKPGRARDTSLLRGMGVFLRGTACWGLVTRRSRCAGGSERRCLGLDCGEVGKAQREAGGSLQQGLPGTCLRSKSQVS